MTRFESLSRTRVMRCIYEHALSDQLVPELVNVLVEVTGAFGGSLWRVDDASLVEGSEYSTITSASDDKVYRERYAMANPIMPVAMRTMRPGDVCTGEQFLGLRDYRRTEFYNEFVRRLGYLHEIGALVDAHAGFNAMLFLAREPGANPFRERERQLLLQVAPHIQRALMLQRSLVTRNAAAWESVAVVYDGVARIDRSGRLAKLQGRIPEELRVRGTLCVRAERLRWIDIDFDSQFHRAINGMLARADARAQTLAVPSHSQRIELDLIPLATRSREAPTSDGVTLVFRERLLAADELAEHFSRHHRLSHAELQVLRLLAAGGTTREISDERGTSIETVRNRVKSILHKTGCRSRTELILKLA